MSANRFDPGQRRDRVCARRTGRLSRRPRPLVTAAGAASLQVTSASARRTIAPSGRKDFTPPAPAALAQYDAISLKELRSLRVHRLEEVGIALGVAQLVEQEVDGVHGTHGIQDATQDVHLLELIGRDEELFLTRTRAGDIHRRERTLVRHLAIENDFG